MTSVTTSFDSTKESLQEILRNVHQGSIQLPDFQRGWIWDDDHIRSLLASVSTSYPIGAVMLLETGNRAVRLKPRPVEGVSLSDGMTPDRLILDGQQRLTSLYQALMYDGPASTKDGRGKAAKRWYYIDIDAALSPNGDMEDAVVSLPEDRVLKGFGKEVLYDCSSTERECSSGLLPLRIVFDIAALTDWQMAYLDIDPSQSRHRLARWNHLVQAVIQRFQQYQVPLIVLRKENSKEAVCKVFEKVNTGGVPLTVFDLLTATYAIDGFELRKHWEKCRKRLDHASLASVSSDDFLQAVTLLATRQRRIEAVTRGTSPEQAPGVSCRRRDVLELPLAAYEAWAEQAIEGFRKAAKVLHSQKVFAARDIPYRTQLVPLACILTLLGDRADHDGVRSKILQWYWCGVFGELYGATLETRFARDLQEVLAWIEGEPEPSTVRDASFSSGRLFTLRSRLSAAYKGLHALLIRGGCLDFLSGDPVDLQMYFDEKIDIHHIFPRRWCERNGIHRNTYNSVVNKTAISAKTNRTIGGNAPSTYLPRLQKRGDISQERMDEILASHVVEPDLVKADDFAAFFNARHEALLRRVEAAMGKSIPRGPADPEELAEEEVLEDEEEAEDSDLEAV